MQNKWCKCLYNKKIENTADVNNVMVKTEKRPTHCQISLMAHSYAPGVKAYKILP